MSEIFLLACIFLFAGVIAVPIASKLKLGSVLGYIIAGIAISPLLLALKVDVITLQHFAEFGVVMMLFLVGLELEPKLLWKMKNKLLGLGGLQVLITIIAVSGLAFAFGQPFKTAIAIGFVLTLSSTAIVLQTLSEKGLMKTDGGNSSFSVLLFQDIAVIPMLALIPLLAVSTSSPSTTEDAHHASLSLVAHLNAWQQAGVTIFAIILIIVLGITLSRPFFRLAASARSREILVAAALAIVMGIALLMSLVELSPALGTFLAGVVLANSEYRHELESNLDPFKGLLLGLFFITVGASIDFGLFFDQWPIVLGLTLGLMLLKWSILYGLAKVFQIRGNDKWLFSMGLAQAGEFAFVLLAFSISNNVISKELSDLLLLVVAFSMLLTPAAFIIQDRCFNQSSDDAKARPADTVDEQESIIIAGHGRFGGTINRMLRGLGYKTTVLDYSYDQLELLRKFNFKVYFGDATRPDLLHAAGIENAKIFVIAIDDKETITDLVRYVSEHYPHVHTIARAVDRHHVYDLYAAGCRDIIRETFDSAVRAGRSALEAMGIHPFEAERKSQQFVKSDKNVLIELAPLYNPDVPAHENPEYVKKAAEIRTALEAELQGQDRRFSSRAERAWSPPTLSDVEAVKAVDAQQT